MVRRRWASTSLSRVTAPLPTSKEPSGGVMAGCGPRGSVASLVLVDDVGAGEVIVQRAVLAIEEAPEPAQAGGDHAQQQGQEAEDPPERARGRAARADHPQVHEPLADGLAGDAAEVDVVERADPQEQPGRS